MAPKISAKIVLSNIRIAQLLMRPARMRNRPGYRRPYLLGIFPKSTGRMVSRARSPFGLAPGEFRLAQFYVKDPGNGVDFDDIAVLQQRDRTTNGGFRADMANTEPTCRPRKAPIGDKSDLAPGALPGQRRRGRQHLAHSRTATRPLITNDEDVTLLIGSLLDGFEGVFLTVEATGRAGKLQIRHSGYFHNRAH